MNFVPDGYVGTAEAIAIVIESAWSDEYQRICAAWREADPESYRYHHAGDSVSLPPEIYRPLSDLFVRAERHLRNMLLQCQLAAVYFSIFGKGTVSAEFWATAEADGTLFAGDYAPFGHNRHSGLVPRGAFVKLLIDRMNLERALMPPAGEKPPPLPRAELPKIVQRLHELPDLTREEQRDQITSEWSDYHIRDADFRKAFKQVPRKRGRQGAKRGRKSGA